jgi:hypothetical protein
MLARSAALFWKDSRLLKGEAARCGSSKAKEEGSLGSIVLKEVAEVQVFFFFLVVFH